MPFYFKSNLSTLILVLHLSWVWSNNKWQGSDCVIFFLSKFLPGSFLETTLRFPGKKAQFHSRDTQHYRPRTYIILACRSETNRMTMMTYSWQYSFSSFNSHYYPSLILWFIYKILGVSSNQRLDRRTWLFIQW